MEFINIKPITFEEILILYSKENGQKNDNWELRNLKRANEKFGKWLSGDLNSKRIKEIVMPYYIVGGASITPKTGALLKDAYSEFSSKKDYFQRENPQFCERVEIQKRLIRESENVKTIYLSEEPLFLGLSYAGLHNFKRKITHLDGFHRLFALMDLEEKPKFIPICLAFYSN